MTWIKEGEVWEWTTDEGSVILEGEDFDEETGLISLEVMPGEVDYMIYGNVDHDFLHWEREFAEVWIDRRAATDFEGPLPTGKLQAYDELRQLVEHAINTPPSRVYTG
jgi:hypothetical protein